MNLALNQPTTDRAALHTLINGLVPSSGTRLYDSLDTVFKRLLPQIKGRKAIVLFTDGVDIDSGLAQKLTGSLVSVQPLRSLCLCGELSL